MDNSFAVTNTRLSDVDRNLAVCKTLAYMIANRSIIFSFSIEQTQLL